MSAIYAVHIAAGALALIAGYVPLFSPKGGPTHRRVGMLFVYSMLVMTTVGAVIALRFHRLAEVNVPAALLTSYLVITGVVTVRTPSWWSRRLDVALMLVAVALALADLRLAVLALAAGGSRNGIPAGPMLMFVAMGFLGVAGDVRMLRAGAPRGSARIARHLWRISLALLIAAMSFFFGQAKVIPKAIRIGPLLAVPQLLVLIVMLYWLWRVRAQRNGWSMRGVVERRAPVLETTHIRAATQSSDTLERTT